MLLEATANELSRAAEEVDNATRAVVVAATALVETKILLEVGNALPGGAEGLRSGTTVVLVGTTELMATTPRL